MTHFKQDEGTTKDAILLRYQGIDQINLEALIEELFFTRGYKLTVAKPGDSSYEKGDYTMRILLGAFVKYFKFRVMTGVLNDGDVSVRVIRVSSGFSGGAIGRNQVTQEMIDLSNLLKSI